MKRILAPALFGLIGIAILVSLGTWQLQRLEWKRAILDRIETTIAGNPQPLPRLISPAEQTYMSVAMDGSFGDGALYVLVSVKRQGPGWRVISDFTTQDGRRVLVDRGFTPIESKAAPRPGAAAQITGNLLWPDDRNSSTPENDVAGNTWFARDVAQMAEALNTEPLLIVARDVRPSDPTLTPMPVDTAGIPNDHLQYAITWFSLAAVWLIMTGVWIMRRFQGKD
ncbi:SURF1 family protein [Tropicibacter naphthalenivorans]|uniref:SURF1-like protein n=1 Tax=Tropicibacter naphthalenivorans TaxID=441103 RepID=A0A0P1G1R9_9RHOB|nr:SURF1 family protein [Tropicibacter naphthalenivorans]CUH75736.1 hypothetical protein TRN7648_00593 [Tropicibacter naphthalenivorans]SMC42571.1 surfeit locus 1 family protein [Tropicibacter naphthalenivorans]